MDRRPETPTAPSTESAIILCSKETTGNTTYTNPLVTGEQPLQVVLKVNTNGTCNVCGRCGSGTSGETESTGNCLKIANGLEHPRIRAGCANKTIGKDMAAEAWYKMGGRNADPDDRGEMSEPWP